MKTEDIDKLSRTIDDSVVVYEDVDKALEDGKINILTEGAPLVIKHAGKAVRLIQAAREIGNELADLDGDEAEQLMIQIAEAYGQGNPVAYEGASHIVKGLAEVRTGIVIIVEDKKKNNTESSGN